MSDFEFFMLLFLFSSLFGLIIGAYYGTMEYRIRQNLPLITLNCICPSCGQNLPLYHQIPVASFLILRGKCHFCHSRIPVRYPLTEGGFMAYYGISFLIFHRTPVVCLLLWYAFICILLLARCGRRPRPLLKGLTLMTLYHAVFSLLYSALYLASFNTLWLPRA